MIGSPIPCGAALARRQNVERIARHIEYVGTLDTTLSGSRNAIAPLFLWYAFRTVGVAGFRRNIERCLETADYAIERLNRAGRHAWRHKNSITVVFDRPAIEVASKWQIAVHGKIGHLITMPHVTREHIDRFVEDIERASGQ
jgi:histidine decarboxylase